jgi:hypothetical protein
VVNRRVRRARPGIRLKRKRDFKAQLQELDVSGVPYKYPGGERCAITFRSRAMAAKMADSLMRTLLMGMGMSRLFRPFPPHRERAV